MLVVNALFALLQPGGYCSLKPVLKLYDGSRKSGCFVYGWSLSRLGDKTCVITTLFVRPKFPLVILKERLISKGSANIEGVLVFANDLKTFFGKC